MFERMTLAALLVTAACGGDDTETKDAGAALAATGATPVTGNVAFSSVDGVVTVTVTMTAGPAGDHGLHIHQEPACGNAGADAGGHWDGTAAAGDAGTHGLPGGAMEHLGDLGNIT